MAKRKHNSLSNLAVVVGVIAALVLSVPVGAYLQTQVFGPLVAQMGPTGGTGGMGGSYQPPMGDQSGMGGSYQPMGSQPTGGYQPMGNQPTGSDQSGGYHPAGWADPNAGSQTGNYQPTGSQTGSYQPTGSQPTGGYQPGGYQPTGSQPTGAYGSQGGMPSAEMSTCTAGGGVWCGTYCKASAGPCEGTGPATTTGGYQPGYQPLPAETGKMDSATCGKQGGKWVDKPDSQGGGYCDFSDYKMDSSTCSRQGGKWLTDKIGNGTCDFSGRAQLMGPESTTTQPKYDYSKTVAPYGPQTTTTQPQPCDGRWVQDTAGGHCEAWGSETMGPEMTGPRMTGPQMMGPEGPMPEGPMTDEERQKFDEQRQQGDVTRELQNIQREIKMFTRDITRQKKDIERMTKQAKGYACPAVTKAQALISEAEKTVTELQSATASSWEDIEALRVKLENLRGGPNAEVDEPIMMQFGNIMPQIGACQGIAQFVKEVQRFAKEIEKDIARENKKGGIDKESLAAMQEILTKLQALEKNPTEGLTEDDMQNGDFVRYLFEDNLQPLREQMDELRRGAGDKMRKAGVCQALQQAKKDVERGSVEAEMAGEEGLRLLEEAKGLITTGMGACEGGDYDTAEKVMFKLESLKQRADELGFGGDAGSKFGPQAGDLLKGSIDDEELIRRLEEKLLSKMENQIKLITEAVQRQLADTLSKIVESKFIQITDALTKSLDNITYLSENAKNIALSNRQQVTNVLGEIEDKKVSTRVGNELKAVTEEALKQNWSTSAMAEIKNKLSDVAAVASSETDALAAIKDLKAEIEEQKTADVDKQVEAGLRPFKDTAPDAWFFGSAATLKEEGILKGTAEGAMDAGRPVALAEAAAMMFRGVGGQENETGGFRAAGVPEWAKGVAGGLASIGVDMANDPKVNFSKDATRGQMAHVIVETLEKQGVIDPAKFECKLNFKDVKCGQPYADDIAVLNQLGIAKGNPDGTFGVSNSLNRAEAAAMVQRTMDEVQGE